MTNSISSLLCISIVIPDFKSHNIIMSARVYFMKTVNGCKDVSIMSLQEQDELLIKIVNKVSQRSLRTNERSVRYREDRYPLTS